MTFDRQVDLDAYAVGMAKVEGTVAALEATIAAGGRVESPVIRPQAARPVG